jgi:dihydrofolate reductase
VVSDLVYTAIASLDGFVCDEQGGFDWAAPDEEVHAFVNDLERTVATYLYGRRMYEVMAFWESQETDHPSSVSADYAALWRAADKVVFSTTLGEVTTARTRLETTFDPEAVRRMKASTEGGLSVGGPTLAAQTLRSGLVDECRLFVVPVVVGGGTRWLPGQIRLDLRLLDQRAFAGGVVYLRYRVRS